MHPSGFPPLIVAARRYPDGSCVAFADVRGYFWAVVPKGTRVRDTADGLVRMHDRWEDAAADLVSLGYGPLSGEGVAV